MEKLETTGIHSTRGIGGYSIRISSWKHSQRTGEGEEAEEVCVRGPVCEALPLKATME